MFDYGVIKSATQPAPIEITDTSVFIASNIEPYTEEVEEHQVSGYKYNYKKYDKDEYLIQQTAEITSLQEELRAAKILLGVD